MSIYLLDSIIINIKDYLQDYKSSQDYTLAIPPNDSLYNFHSQHIFSILFINLNSILYILPQMRVIIDRQEMAQKGNIDNPINLNDDEFQQNKIADDQLEEARNRAILDQAKISGSKTQICLAVVKTMIPGQSSIKSKIVKKQIIKYFYNTINIKIHCQHFNNKREPDYSDPSTQPNSCELILHGVDFLTTAMILKRFTIVDVALKQIKWIDDSSCKLIYGSAQETERAIQSQLIDVAGWKIKQEQNNNNQSREWFSLRPYWIHSFERPMTMRYATNRQKNIQKCSLAKYELYEKAEEQLYQYLLVTFHAVDKYIRTMQQVQIQNKINKRNYRNSGYTNRVQRRNHHIQDYGNIKNQLKNNKYKTITKNHQSKGLKSVHIRQITITRYEHLPVNFVQSNSLHRRTLSQSHNEIQHNSQELNFQQKQNFFEDTDEIGPNLSFELKSNNLSYQEDESNQNNNLPMNSILWSFHQEKANLNQDLSFTKKIQQNKDEGSKNDEFDLNFIQSLGEKKANPITVPQQDDLCFTYKKGNQKQEISEDYSFYRTTSNQPNKINKSQLNIFNSYKKKEMSKNSIPLDISSDQSERY